MLKYNPSIPLFSIHIPKAGGSSFEKILRSWFGKYLFHHYYNERIGLPPKAYNLRSKKRFLPFLKTPEVCIHGHFHNGRGIGVKDYYPYAQQCITIARDPLDAALSNFFFAKRMINEGQGYYDGKANSLEEPLDQWIKRNDSLLPYFMPVPVDESNYMEVIKKFFVHIGVMDNYQKSVEIIATKLNKTLIDVPHEKSTPRDIYPSKEAINIFKKRNKFAYMIYDYILMLNE